MSTPTVCRPIKGFPGYAVCETGEVISFKGKKPRFLKPGRTNCGHARDYYLVVRLSDATKNIITKPVHHLVAQAFLGDRPKGMVIDHIDGNSFNNHYTNLRYCTQKENLNNPNSKSPGRPRCPVIACKDGVEQSFKSCNEMCKRLGLKNSAVSLCLSNKSGYRISHGYTFRRG